MYPSWLQRSYNGVHPPNTHALHATTANVLIHQCCAFLCHVAHPQGVLAANIFDWGARACVELYRDGTILEIYRQVR